jgi:hypothetical protein
MKTLLEAEAYAVSGTVDSAEVPINGLTPPAGNMPEVPWAAALPPVLLAGLGVVWMKRTGRLSKRYDGSGRNTTGTSKTGERGA